MGCYKNKKADGPGGEHAGNNHDKVHFNPISSPLSIFISTYTFSFLPLIGCNSTAVVIILCIAYGMTGIAAVSLVPALGIDLLKFCQGQFLS